MKTVYKKIAMVLTIFLLIVLAISCQSTGEYLPLSNNETVIGTVQVTFTVQSSFFFMKKVKDGINTEAYIKLLETAEHKYSGNNDIRDIVWVTGQSVNTTNTEIFATGKVIRLDGNEAERFSEESH
jgi:hypothetical protein